MLNDERRYYEGTKCIWGTSYADYLMIYKEENSISVADNALEIKSN